VACDEECDADVQVAVRGRRQGDFHELAALDLDPSVGRKMKGVERRLGVDRAPSPGTANNSTTIAPVGRLR